MSPSQKNYKINSPHQPNNPNQLEGPFGKMKDVVRRFKTAPDPSCALTQNSARANSTDKSTGTKIKRVFGKMDDAIRFIVLTLLSSLTLFMWVNGLIWVVQKVVLLGGANPKVKLPYQMVVLLGASSKSSRQLLRVVRIICLILRQLPNGSNRGSIAMRQLFTCLLFVRSKHAAIQQSLRVVKVNSETASTCSVCRNTRSSLPKLR